MFRTANGPFTPLSDTCQPTLGQAVEKTEGQPENSTQNFKAKVNSMTFYTSWKCRIQLYRAYFNQCFQSTELGYYHKFW